MKNYLEGFFFHRVLPSSLEIHCSSVPRKEKDLTNPKEQCVPGKSFRTPTFPGSKERGGVTPV